MANWVQGAGTSGDDKINSVGVDGSGNTYVVGQMGTGSITFGTDVLNNTGGNPNGFVAKYNSSGVAQWGILLHNYLGGQVTDLLVDAGGNIIVCGEFTDSLELNPKGSSTKILTQASYIGAKNFYIAKYNSNGILQWHNYMQSSGEWDARGITADPSGNIYVTGSGYGDLVNNLATDSAKDLTSAVEMPFIAKFTSSGAYEKVIIIRTAADNLGAKAYDIGVGKDGKIVVCGSTEDSITIGGSNKVPDLMNSKADAFIAKYTNQLQDDWGLLIGGEDEDEALALFVDDSSMVWITGSMQNSFSVASDNLTSNGAKDVLFVKINANGAPIGGFNLGGSGNDLGLAIDFDNNQTPWVSGVFTGSAVDFDPGTGTHTLNGGTNEEAFIAHYDRIGDYLSAIAIGDASTGAERGHSIVYAGTSDLYLAGLFSSGNAEFNPLGTSLKLNNLGDRDAFVAKYSAVSCPVDDAGAIKGSGKLCMGDERTFSISPVNGATTYNWVFQGDPQQIIHGQGTNTLTILVNNSQSSTLVVTPGNGTCTGAPANLNLTVATPPTWDNINTTNPTCGKNNGSISVSMNGVGPFTYLWSNGDIVAQPDSLTSGGYNVTVTDNGTSCQTDSLISLNDDGAPSITAAVLTKPKCFGEANGSISLTLTGGTTPIKYSWSNGDTTKDISGVEAGGHRVVIKDANGCSTSQIYYLGENAELKARVTVQNNSTCGVNDGVVTAIPSGGVEPYKYLWSNSDTSKVLNGLTVGAYKLVLTDSLGCKDSVYADVSDNKGPTITLDSLFDHDCQLSNGSIYISGTFSLPLTYAWSNSTSSEDLTGVGSGLYSVTASGGSCKGIKTFEVKTKTPKMNPICMVTVDDSSKKNLLVFERGAKGTIARYIFYHESWQPGFYHEIGSSHVDSLSYWIDPLSDPQLKAWKYKMVVEDKCGAVSDPSTSHSTLHLVVENGALGTNNLRWTPYNGFPYDTVYVDRFETGKGWTTIDSVPAQNTTYTDANAPKNDKGLLYALGIQHPFGCLATRANSKNFNTSRSNRSAPPSALKADTTDTTTKPVPNFIHKGVYGNQYLVYPNPNQGVFKVKIPNSDSKLIGIQLYDLNGRIIWSETNGLVDETELNIDLKEAKPGTYLLEIEDSGGREHWRIVIQ